MAVLISVLWFSIANTLHKEHNNATYKIVLKENTEYMREIINNLIIRIEHKRETIFAEAEEWIRSYQEQAVFPTAELLEAKAMEISRHVRYLEIGDAVRLVMRDAATGKKGKICYPEEFGI